MRQKIPNSNIMDSMILFYNDWSGKMPLGQIDAIAEEIKVIPDNENAAIDLAENKKSQYITF